MRRPDPPESWADLPFFTDGRWPALWNRLSALPDWQPAPERLFRALALTPRASVRVVILGQDPYPTPGRATGLAFSFPPASPHATACEIFWPNLPPTLVPSERTATLRPGPGKASCC